MTARETSRAGTKVGLSDPVVPSGRAIAKRTKGTPGITGLSPPRVHIDGEVWHLDVGSSHPGAGAGPKGLAVRQLKRYASWVLLVREDRNERTAGVSVVLPRASQSSYVRTG